MGVFAVWLVVTVAEPWVTMPKWSWYLSMAVLGLAWELLVEWDVWYLGLGVGGGAATFALVADLVLVVTDSVRVSLLRRNR